MTISHCNNSTYIIIVSEKCKGCRYCLAVCPEGVIGLATQLNQNGCNPAVVLKEKSDLCTGCASCAVMCPDAAISVYRRKHAPNTSSP